VRAVLLAENLVLQNLDPGHFPQSCELSTIGGWVASRSSGQQSLRYGRIEQLLAGGVEIQKIPMDINTPPRVGFL
jgi:alkyldihydroxyacetonephosphate synthase